MFLANTNYLIGKIFGIMSIRHDCVGLCVCAFIVRGNDADVIEMRQTKYCIAGKSRGTKFL